MWEEGHIKRTFGLPCPPRVDGQGVSAGDGVGWGSKEAVEKLIGMVALSALCYADIDLTFKRPTLISSFETKSR